MLGVAYKKDGSHIRESLAFDIIQLLLQKGVVVSYYYPHVPSFKHGGLALQSVVDLDAVLAVADGVMIVTDHSAYEWEGIIEQAALIVDTRYVIVGAPVALFV